MNFPKSYELLKEQEIPEIGGTGYILKHIRSGAHLFLLACPDSNKVFSIAFRTTPENDTGVAHIMEHSVLCGSLKYPVKDPFVELAKGSLNTFLNAFTYPDKTVYPVASCNDADFRNLMSVYMDAVFNPNIYRNEKIFRQEGWHYELQEPDGELTVNGVVYNEMRGASSDPDDLMERYSMNMLYPDLTYSHESGGAPEAIPALSYEEFLNFHRRYYHPSNSYIYLYGDADMEERLSWLDEAYLSSYEAIDPETEIPEQKPFSAPREKVFEYAVSEGEEEEGYIYGLSVSLGDLFDPVRSLAYEVLSYALLNAPGAPVRQALLDAQIGTDIYGGYDSSVRQPMFQIVIKGCREGEKEHFAEVIEQALLEQAEKKIPERTLLAAINSIEFSLREGDYGRMPKGLMYGLQALETWLHDDMSPMIHLAFDEPFRELRSRIGTGYFEQLIREKLIENPHRVILSEVPKAGLTKEADDRMREKLAAYKASLSPEEIERIIADTKALKAYQDEPSTEEELLSIPLLRREDLRRNITPYANEEREVLGVPVIFHPVHTSGISYFDIRFDLSEVDTEDLPYISLMKLLYTQMNTEHYTYRELNDEIGLLTGGISAGISSFAQFQDPDEITEQFGIRGKCLTGNTEDLLKLVKEILFGTDFSDTHRIREILSEEKADRQNDMTASGHSTAAKRVLSYSSKLGKEDDMLAGLDFYRFLEELLSGFEERKNGLPEKLRELSKKMLKKDLMIVSLTGEEEAFSAFSESFGLLAEGMESGAGRKKIRREIDVKTLNEGFMSASQVQYAAKGGNFAEAGYSYHGSMAVLKTLLGYDYLWINLRVKGGAYGCMSSFGHGGEMVFVSYRDPNLSETLDVYDGIPDYLETLSISDRDMTKYIIGTMSDIDTPLTPSLLGARSFAAYQTGITEADAQKERDEILNTTVEDLKALAPCVRAVLSENRIAAVGSEEVLRKEEKLFSSLSYLTGEHHESD